MTSLAQSYTYESHPGTSLAVQWLRLCAPNAGGMGSIPGQGTKIPHVAWHSLKNKKKILNFKKESNPHCCT